MLTVNRRNSEDVIVHNQCANLLLSNAVKSHSGLNVEDLTQLYDNETAIPSSEYPKPGDIKVIVAGLPWYVHYFLLCEMNLTSLSTEANRTPG